MKRILLLLFLCLSLKNVFAQINLTAGLVAYFPFNGNTNDASGNGNNATNFGATLTTDQWGNPNNAYAFNGFSQYMQVPNSASLQVSSFTLCTRVKPTGFYNGLCFNNIIIAKGNSAGYTNGDFGLSYTPTLNQDPTTYCVIQDSLHENYRVYAGSTGAANSLACITPVNGIPYVNTNQWDCVIGVYDSASQTAKVYVNGIFRYSYINANPIGVNSSDVFIGKQNTAGYEYWMNATLDEIRVYNRVLNLQELDSVCNFNPNIVNDSIAANFQYSIPNNCDSSSIQFSDLSVGYNSNVTNWNWNFGDGNFSSSQNPTHHYATSGMYTVTLIATSNTGKLDTFSISIQVVSNLMVVTATASPISVCTGNPTTLNASGALTYSWSGGVTNGVSFIPSSTSTYTVVGTDANGCTNTSSVTVNVGPNLLLTITPSNPLLCLGDSVQLNVIGGMNYSWTPNSAINSATISNPIVYPNATTIYNVLGSDATGCTGSASVTIEVVNDPKLTISKSGDIECNTKTIQLTATGASTYSWSPATYLSSPNSANTNAFITDPTMFVVTGIVGSCIIKDSIFVNVFNNDESSLFIPNAFSPNGDGINDCLKIVNKANFMNFYFSIYNRFGQRVFETDNSMQCWDGYFKSQPAETGVYYYYLKAETNCGKIFKKGDIMLIR